MSHPGDGCGTAESCQLHQLVHTEAILTEELLINVLGLLLPVERRQVSLDSRHTYSQLTVGKILCVQYLKLHPRYLMVWAMVDASLLLKQSFLMLLAAADREHVPAWERTVVALEVTRKPIPNRVRTLNIQMDPNTWDRRDQRDQQWTERSRTPHWPAQMLVASFNRLSLLFSSMFQQTDTFKLMQPITISLAATVRISG